MHIAGIEERHRVDDAVRTQIGQIDHSRAVSYSPVCHCDNPPGCAQVDIELTRMEHPAGQGGRPSIPHSRIDRGSRSKPCGSGRARRAGTNAFPWPMEFREDCGIHAYCLQDVPSPLLRVQIHGACRRAGRHIAAVDTGQPPNQIILGIDEHMANLRIPVGLMPGHPHQFGHRQGPVARVPHSSAEGPSPVSFNQLGRLLFGPAVRVQDCRPDRLPLRIHGDQILHLSAHDDTGDLVALEMLDAPPGPGQKVTGHLNKGL